MDHGPRELLELALHDEFHPAGGGRGGDEQPDVGDHAWAASEVELAAGDGAVREDVLAQTGGKVGGALSYLAVKEALWGREGRIGLVRGKGMGTEQFGRTSSRRRVAKRVARWAERCATSRCKKRCWGKEG
jgi:hypothetical protein